MGSEWFLGLGNGRTCVPPPPPKAWESKNHANKTVDQTSRTVLKVWPEERWMRAFEFNKKFQMRNKDWPTRQNKKQTLRKVLFRVRFLFCEKKKEKRGEEVFYDWGSYGFLCLSFYLNTLTPSSIGE